MRDGFCGCVLALALGLSAARANAEPCEPARIVAERAALPEAWRRALDELDLALAKEGHLWSCAGGDLDLVVTGAGTGVLRRRDPRGREVTRRLPGPGDLVPTAEALLAPAAPPAAPTVAPISGLPPPPASARLAPASAPQDPRLLVEALVGVRYGGTLRAVWGAGTLRITVPIEAWSAGAWVRYGIPYVLDPVPMDFSMSDLGFGLSLGRQLLISGPLELQATFDPSIGFVSMEGGAESRLVQSAKVDGRIGLGLRATLRWSRRWRSVVALDGELAPASAAKARRIDPSLPPLPAYGVGASVGVGAAFR